MDIVRLAGFSFAAAITTLTVRRIRPEFGPVLALFGGAVLLGLAAPAIAQLIDSMSAFGRQGGVAGDMMQTLLKITGVSFLMEFAARTCHDAGENSLAAHTELAGRIAILVLALPSMQQLLGLILSIGA